MTYLVPLKNITLEQCYKLYEKGYNLVFNYDCKIPYVSYFIGD